jgi:hypothetical protein
MARLRLRARYVDCAKQSQLSDFGLRIGDGAAAGRPLGPAGPGPVVQTNPIGWSELCKTNPIYAGPKYPSFQHSIIPAFQLEIDRAKQSQFRASGEKGKSFVERDLW